MSILRQKKILSLLVTIILILSLLGCSSGAQAPKKEEAKQPPATQEAKKPEAPKKEEPKQEWTKKMSVASGAEGSAGYAKMVAWTSFMNEFLGLNLSVEATSGSATTPKLVETGEVEFGTSSASMAYEAWSGTGWAKGKKHTNIRTLGTVDPFALQFYALSKSNIKSIEDLKGKHIALSKAGSAVDQWGRRVLEKFNIKPSKISNTSPSEANDLMKNGVLHAAGVMGSVHPSITELTASEDVRVFGLSQEQIDVMTKEATNFFPVEFPAGTYKGQAQPFKTIGEYHLVIVNKDVPEDLVYEITKAMYENKEKLAKAYEPYLSIDPKHILYTQTPLHAGAYKYFVEKGIQIPEALKPVK